MIFDDPNMRHKLAAQGFEIPPREQQTPEALGASHREVVAHHQGREHQRETASSSRAFRKGNAMKLPRRQFLHLAAGAAALPVASRFAFAEAYPTRPVRVIVGFTPGGAPDILARLMGQWLSERLGQQFVIDNRP